MRTKRPHCKELQAKVGKRKRSGGQGHPPLQTILKPHMTATVQAKASIVRGTWGGVQADLMLDSGSSVSLVEWAFLECNKPAVEEYIIAPTYIL